MTTATNGDHVYLGEEIIGDFAQEGSQKLASQLENDGSNVSSLIFTELILAYDDNRLQLDDVISFLEKVLANESRSVEFCQILDVFVLSEQIKQLVASLFKKNIVKTSVLARNIRPEILLAVGIVPENFNKILNTRRRDHFYTQKKYNLLHEESEGYSKLVVEVYHILRDDHTQYQLEYAFKVIENLVGHYNLDPNRVLDVLIDVFSNNFVSNHRFIIGFLKRSQWWPRTESDSTTSMLRLVVGGSDTASKLIGLRLLKCRKDRELPETFKILIGCLIKEGFLSFGSIFPYFNTEEMEPLELLYKKHLEDRVLKASANALSLAAPLVDEDEESGTDGKSKPTENEETTLQSSLLSNLVYQFLRVFLAVGLYYPSLYILTKYPFLAYVDDEIPELINRLFLEMLAPLHTSFKSISDTDLDQLQTSRQSASTVTGNSVIYEEVTQVDLYSFRPTAMNHGTKKFTYFYNEWKDCLPTILTVEELFNLSYEFLKFNGANLSKNADLFSQICDIAVADYNQTDENHLAWFKYFRNFIYPAMSVVEENPFLIEKGFAVMQCFSLEDRYNLYGELHQVLSKSNPLIQIAYGKAEKSTKDILKRLSKENVRPMMRRLAKTSFANPLPCLLTILQQIESYDNLIPLVVDTAKYFNQYGWEALTLAILMRLSASGRSSIQQDGLNERQWIQSLAQFVGKICQRYPTLIDLNTLVSFILKSLHQKDMIAVIVLKEMLMSMGGIQSINNLTLAQIDMMNCEPSLQKLAYRTVNDTRYECLSSGHQLINVIHELGAENELFIQLCQLSQDVAHSTNQTHLKILANKNDEMNSVIQLYIQFYNFFGSKQTLSRELIPIKELCDVYHIEPRWVYRIWSSIETSDGNIPQVPQATSPHLYDTFWRLSLYDINFSLDLYDDEVAKLEGTIPSLKESVSSAKKDKAVLPSAIEKYRKTLDQNLKFIRDIPSDAKTHSSHNKEINIMLTDQKDKFFELASVEELRSFLQYCVLPRAITSSFDASFAAKFLFKLHDLEVANYSVLLLLDELFGNQILFGTLFTLSPLEAENLGIFYSEVLRVLNEWTDKVLFKQNCSTLFNDGVQITYDQFRTMLFTYHEKLLSDVGNSLTVTEYMSRRNAITFLKNLLGVYPNVEDHCETMLGFIQNISDREERQDLKLSSYALIGHLRSRSKDWVHIWEFIPMSDEEKERLIREHNDRKEQEKQEKLRLAEKAKQQQLELAEKAKQEQLKLKIEKENKEREKKLQSATLSYDDSSRPSSRADIRKLEPKSRYDYYNKYEGSTSDSKDSSKAEKAQPKAEKEEENQDEGDQMEIDKESSDANNDKTEAKETEEQTTKDIKDEPREQERPDIKQRIEQAKRKLRDSPTPQSSKTATPEPDLFPLAPKDDARRNRPIRRPRAPLPPQEAIASRGPPPQDRNRRFNDRSRYTPPSRGSSEQVPPPPPPPPPPPSRNQPGRWENKRRRDTYEGRGYEKRQKR